MGITFNSEEENNNIKKQKSKLQLIYDSDVKKNNIMEIDDLLELRNRIMLAEVPEQLEGLDIQSLVSKFIDQLKLLLQIQTTLKKLQKSGHLSYQNYSENY